MRRVSLHTIEHETLCLSDHYRLVLQINQPQFKLHPFNNLIPYLPDHLHEHICIQTAWDEVDDVEEFRMFFIFDLQGPIGHHKP